MAGEGFTEAARTGNQGVAAQVKPASCLAQSSSLTDGGVLSYMHLDRMTDSTGLIQHAIYSIPRRESGYTTDDNARALRLCARLWNECPDERMLERVACYLSFTEHARCPVRGFHNFLSYQRGWLDATGEGDCQGQAVLALAEVLASRLPAGFRALARELIEGACPGMAALRSLRAQAYVIQAWAHLWRADINDIRGLESIARLAADRLVECFRRSHRPDWPWFESRMTYANAVLPHAMFDASERWPDEAFRDIAESSFAFLDRVTTVKNVFWTVGNRDWYSLGDDKSLYDQQPVEAATMAAAALAGLRLVGDDSYLSAFLRANGWFNGENCQKCRMADRDEGSCFDGLQPCGVNRNQGAEAMLGYLWSESESFKMLRAPTGGARKAIGAV